MKVKLLHLINSVYPIFPSKIKKVYQYVLYILSNNYININSVNPLGGGAF